MKKERKQRIQTYEVSKKVNYNLSGIQQQVVLDGRYRTSPLMLFLHGGPGSSMPFNEGSRGTNQAFSEKYIMVYWDQLGCGINNHIIDESFTIQSYVDMCIELIQLLKEEFALNPIVLFGVSWGSVLACKVASQVPQWITCVLSYSQVVKDLCFNEEVYKYLANQPLPIKQQTRLERLQSSPTKSVADMKFIMKLLSKHGDGYVYKQSKSLNIVSILGDAMSSPDYNLRNVVALLVHGYANNKSLYLELLSVDLSMELLNTPVPYIVLQGESDLLTSANGMKELMQQNDNPNVTLEVIAKSSHLPSLDAMELITAKAIQIAISIAQKKETSSD